MKHLIQYKYIVTYFKKVVITICPIYHFPNDDVLSLGLVGLEKEHNYEKRTKRQAPLYHQETKTILLLGLTSMHCFLIVI